MSKKFKGVYIMEFGEIFKDALKYPMSNPKSLLIVGVLFLISSLPRVLRQFGVVNKSLNLVWIVVLLIISIILMGYALSVLKKAIGREDGIPGFDWTNNFMDGIKLLVVEFIYMIIPSIICSVIAFITMAPVASRIISYANVAYMATNSTNPNVILSAIPAGAWSGLATGMIVTAIIAVILFIIFGLFMVIAQCRLAKYDSLGEAFSFGEVFSDIKEIGFLRLIGFIIVLWLIACVIGLIGSVISAIPVVGWIITLLVIYPFTTLYLNRGLGLLYSDI